MKTIQTLAAITALAATQTVAAQQTKDSVRVVELSNVEVVSTRATRTTPMAFTDVKKQDIQKQNFGKDIPFLLQATPSVIATSDAGTGIGYTGIKVRGTDPTRINITANGIPLNDSESNLVYFSNMPDFASNVQNIQIQRGVGTSGNGAGAFGATINMQTDFFSMQPYGSVDVSGGSYGTHKETLKFGTGLINGHFALEGRLSNIGSDGYIDRASAKMNSYFVQAAYYLDKTNFKFVTFNGKEETYHAWDYSSKDDWKEHGRTYNPSGKFKDDAGRTTFYDDQKDFYHQQHYQLLANHIFSDYVKANLGLHYTHGHGYYEQYKESQKLYKYHLTSDLGSRSDLIRQKIMDNDFYGAVASLNYRRGRVDATIGGSWNKYDGDHYGHLVWVREFSNATAPLMPGLKYYDNNARKTEGNVYGKLTYNITDGLNAFADLQYRGVRYHLDGMSQEYDNNKQQIPFNIHKTYNFFNPKFGLSYVLADRHNFYASYSIAHKEPTRNAFEDRMAETHYVEPKAERLNDLEAGYQYNSDIFSAGVNFYYMKYDNQFVLTGAQDANGEMIARNIKDSYRMGVELTAGLRPVKGLEWNVSMTWSKNRAKGTTLNVVDMTTWDDSRTVNVGTTHLAYSPSLTLSSTLRYEWKGLSASLQTIYVGEQYMTNSNFRSYIDDATGRTISAMIDAYCVSNLDLSYTFKLKTPQSITVGCTVYNLFNHEYESNGSCCMYFREKDGKLEAFHNESLGFYSWATYSCQAPIHFMAHLSLNF